MAEKFQEGWYILKGEERPVYIYGFYGSYMHSVIGHYSWSHPYDSAPVWDATKVLRPATNEELGQWKIDKDKFNTKK